MIRPVAEALVVRDLDTLLDDAAPSRFGGKALGLARAARAGVRVPRGVAIAAGAAANPDTAVLLEGQLRETAPTGALAVRSSGIAEDGAVESLAGRFVSFIPVDRGALWSAVQAVASSGPPGELAVLVHEHVAATEQGVAFSRDPRPGGSGAVVERWKHGEQAPRVERLRAGAGDAVHDALVHSMGLLAPVFGTSLDVEWAFSERLTVLQVRPVTAVGHAAAEAFEAVFAGDRDRWALDGEHNPGPLSPAQAALCALVSGAPGVSEMRVVCGFLFTRAAAREGSHPTIDEGLARCEEALSRVEQAPSLAEVLAAYREFAIAYAALGRALSEPRRRLLVAARALGADVEALALTSTSAVGARDQDLHQVALGRRSLEAHLARFGAFAPTWDVASPTFGEDPAGLVPCTLPQGGGPTARGALAARAPVLAPLIEAAHEAARLREDDDVLFARAQTAVRRALLAVARSRGLDPAEDVFWVPPQTIARLSNDEIRRAADQARRAQHPGLLPPLEIIAGRAVWPPPASRAISGFGTGGRAQGYVVHVGSLDAAPEPRVLVTETITPALGHHLAGLAALVVEHGGPLGHAAIQARERGLPAVVGAAGAMALQVGCLVIVDADEGLVYLPVGTEGSLRGAVSRL